MSVVRILYGGAEITPHVLLENTGFIARVNGQVGTALVRIKDVGHSFRPITGQRLVCEIDDKVKWTGFGARVAKAYFFPAEDTNEPGEVVRVWEIAGVDDNILFDKRIVFDPTDPAGHIDFEYMPGAFDDTIIKDIFDHYLDLRDDNIIRSGVTRVGRAILDIPGVISARGTRKTTADYESTVHTGTVAAAGYTWGQMMDVVQRATGAIYYLDGVTRSDKRILRYVDVEAVSSDYALTDTPDLSIELGAPDPNAPPPGDPFDRADIPLADDSHQWGTSPDGFEYETGRAQMGIVDETGVAEISAAGGEDPFAIAYNQSYVATVLAFKFKTSSVPSTPGVQSVDPDDPGWHSMIKITLWMGSDYHGQINVGSYAPAVAPVSFGAFPLDNWDNPSVTVGHPSGGDANDPVSVLKTDWVADTWYSVRMEYDVANSIHRMKVWPSADPEPGAWLVERDPGGDSGAPLGSGGNQYGFDRSGFTGGFYYDIWAWDNYGTDTATISIDNFDLGLGPPPPGSTVNIDNPIGDGGFEESLAGFWEEIGDGTSRQNSPDPFEGEWILVVNSVFETCGVRQTFEVPEHAEELSLRYAGNFGFNPEDGLRVVLEDLTDAITYEIVPLTQLSDSNTWLLATFDVTGMIGHDVTLSLLSEGNNFYEAYFDNVRVTGSYVVPLPPPTTHNRLNGSGAYKGYREVSIIENGTHLTNDMHVWGAALGAKLMVHSQTENEASIDLHGRWVDGLFTNGLYKQVSADLVSASYVNGTPESKRGRKDDQVTFSCKTFMPVFNVGEVVACACSIWDFEAALPLREMKITFFSPTIPVFDLTLGHEIDQPWSFYESLRKMPRPIEIRMPDWVFPSPLRFPYCPSPVDFPDAPPGLASVFQQDYGGEDPPTPLTRWQPSPLCGAHWVAYADDPRTAWWLVTTRSLTERIPGITGEGGFITETRLSLATPVSGPIEYLMAVQFNGGQSYQFGDIYGSGFGDFRIELWNSADDNPGPPYDAVRVTVTGRTTQSESVTVLGNLQITTGYFEEHADLPLSYSQIPLWVRALVVPGQGRFIKVWPRLKKEPVAWSAVASDGSIIPGPISIYVETLGPRYDVLHTMWFKSAFQRSPGRIEAIAIYAAPSTLSAYWMLCRPDDNGVQGIFGMVRPSDAETAPFHINWWSYDDAGYFNESRILAPVLDNFPTWTRYPDQTLGWSWPQFQGDEPWSSSELYLQYQIQRVMSFRCGIEFPDIDFAEDPPTEIEVTGELAVVTSSGLFNTWTSTNPNTPVPLTLSINGYEYGEGSPIWIPYEAEPTLGRQYVFYDAVGATELIFVPFSFRMPGRRIFQWGVSFTGDMQQIFRAAVGTQPPGRFFLPTTAETSVRFRKVAYRAIYDNHPCGTHWCVPDGQLPVVGDAVGLPAFDSGDQLTYVTGTAFSPGSTTVWVNGILQRFGTTEDYTERPSAGQIVFNSPLDPSDEVIVDYVGIGPADVVLP